MLGIDGLNACGYITSAVLEDVQGFKQAKS